MHLTQLAREHGDKPAVIMGESGATLSYAELERQSNKIAQLFRSRGLRPGDHIAVCFIRRGPPADRRASCPRSPGSLSGPA